MSLMNNSKKQTGLWILLSDPYCSPIKVWLCILCNYENSSYLLWGTER